jgi:hypothetical protein
VGLKSGAPGKSRGLPVYLSADIRIGEQFMKKTHFFSLPVIILALGLTVIGCDNDASDNDDGEGRTITITGITGLSGAVGINIATQFA